MINKRLPFLLLGLLSPVSFGAPSGEAVLGTSDAIRNPQIDYVMSVKVTTTRPKKEPQISTYRMWVKGREMSVVKQLTPELCRYLQRLGHVGKKTPKVIPVHQKDSRAVDLRRLIV